MRALNIVDSGRVEIEEHAIGTVIVFELRGRLTLGSFGVVKDRVRTLVEHDGRCVVVDLSAVSYVDSIGVAELVRSDVIVRNHDGRLAFAVMPAQIRQLLHVTRLDQVFDRFDTQAQAIEHVARTDA